VVPTEGGSSGIIFGAQLRLRIYGTTIWIDPDRQLFVCWLTNRVHPTRENHKIAECAGVHDAVMKAWGLRAKRAG